VIAFRIGHFERETSLPCRHSINLFCTLQAYNREHAMIFVELNPFLEFRRAHCSDEELRALQNILLERPDAGPVIPGAGGLRKLRWALAGRGKRGGARVVYYWHGKADRVYLVLAYAKNEQDNLTPDQARQLAKIVEGVMRDE
jgi:hypothetical protein